MCTVTHLTVLLPCVRFENFREKPVKSAAKRSVFKLCAPSKKRSWTRKIGEKLFQGKSTSILRVFVTLLHRLYDYCGVVPMNAHDACLMSELFTMNGLPLHKDGNWLRLLWKALQWWLSISFLCWHHAISIEQALIWTWERQRVLLHGHKRITNLPWLSCTCKSTAQILQLPQMITKCGWTFILK